MSMSKPMSRQTYLSRPNPKPDERSPFRFNQQLLHNPEDMHEESDQFCKSIFKSDVSNRSDCYNLFSCLYLDDSPMHTQFPTENINFQMQTQESQINYQENTMEVISLEESQNPFQPPQISSTSLYHQPIGSSTNLSIRQSSSLISSTQDSTEDQGDFNRLSLKRSHLKGKRNPKGSIQGQYPTKNLEQAAKKIHLDYILTIKGERFLKKHPYLEAIFKKKSTSRQEFLILYQYRQLVPLWQVFFQKEIIYQKLMQSKVRPENRVRFMPYLDSFQYAFLTGNFEKLTVPRTEELRMLKSQRQSAM